MRFIKIRWSIRRKICILRRSPKRIIKQNGNRALRYALRRDEVGDNFGPIIVPQGCYFAMGDNRDGSFDSRFWGPLPDHFLKGKALVVYWPFDRVKWIR